MTHRQRLITRKQTLEGRWQLLNDKLSALQAQSDLETRVEERLRIDALITETRQQFGTVEVELQELENELSPSNTNIASVVPSPSLDKKRTQPVQVFYSYAHEDELFCDQLVKHLKLLEHEGVISAWHDRQIPAGEEWEEQIDSYLEDADIILLLISADFINSDYCWSKELMRAMERHEAAEARVIPIIVRPVDWTSAPFGKLQALPKDARPISEWQNRDSAFLDVAKAIRRLVSE